MHNGPPPKFYGTRANLRETCVSSSMASGTDRELRAPRSAARGHIVRPAVVGAGVGDLDQLAGAGGVQAGAVVALVLRLVASDAELAGGDHGAGVVVGQHGHRR